MMGKMRFHSKRQGHAMSVASQDTWHATAPFGKPEWQPEDQPYFRLPRAKAKMEELAREEDTSGYPTHSGYRCIQVPHSINGRCGTRAIWAEKVALAMAKPVNLLRYRL